MNFYTLVRRIESYILTTVHDFRAFESVKGGAFMNLKVAAEKFAQAFINTSRGVNIFTLKMYSGGLKKFHWWGTPLLFSAWQQIQPV